MDTSTNELINVLKYDHLLIISTYTRTSICVATEIGLWNLDVAITVQLVAFVINWTIFTSALLIGASIETSLMDSFKVLLIILSVISALIIPPMVIVYFFQQNVKVVIILFKCAEILLFIMIIFYSHFTVGTLRYRLFYPNYTLAALLLYIMFSTALPITDDLVYTMRNNWNVTKFNWIFT
ncbi:unnamed protein product [Schistosoma bovis]|nr:unnamed protein product [Schistosoma bovis]